ncbi:hypothetical protein CYY_008612 [Polysphondylium violaceum]|uniref:CPSF domain-containing protein n=1 Tax=Polysphondylium violaceum TaxID=133409 RepID=A0A8J4UQ24_9MYCE|nr:hypothetical protein CYY_008612 [Polysphondylium violaceum]
MYLYNLTLQRPTAVFQSISGNFSGTKVVEILLNHGRALELLRYDEDGKIESILYTEVFGIIRSIIPFRLTSGTKDYIIVGSDSGRVVILEYNPLKNQFDKVHQETFGRTGCRRIIPGQYLAVDPKGRAFMIGAIEKQKLVYILNRDSTAKLTISSPLEAHKAHTIVFSMCGVDVGFENPIFATISVDYSDDGDLDDVQEQHKKKMLTFYELDLGLNNVVRKWSDEVDYSANIVMTVPGGTEGPGGVLICSENYIAYKNQGHPEKRAQIPRRMGTDPDKGLMIISHSSHKQKGMFFFLVQSEVGDLYKITLDYQGEIVNQVVISYFDTIPVANCITVLKNGFLFAASEFGNHGLYFFKGLGDNEDTLIEAEGQQWFEERGELKHLELTSSIGSLVPVLDYKVLDLVQEENPQMYALCGTSKNSSLKVLRYGLPVNQMAETPLPGVPSGIWTLPKTNLSPDEQQSDKFIIVSFVGTTSVLRIGDNIEEDHDSGILETTTTLLIRPLGQDAILQVYSNGIRHIKADKRINEWRAPGRKSVLHATSNQTQVVLALSGGELIYFELDQAGNLSEVMKKDMRRDISCIEISPIPKGRILSRFLAVSDWEGPVRVLSLDRDNCLSQVSMFDTDKVQIESLSIVDMPIQEAGVDNTRQNAQQHRGAAATLNIPSTLFLFIGLKNGVLKRAIIDSLTGELSDVRTRFLGRKPVRFFRIKVKGNNALLALSSRVWLNYSYQGKLEMTPLSIEPLDNASSFSSDQCSEGVVATVQNNLKIFTLDKLGENFNQISVPLQCSPKRFIIHPQTNYMVVLESETNYNTEDLNLTELNRKLAADNGNSNNDDQDDMEFDEKTNNKKNKKIYKPKAGKGMWRSFIRIMDPVSYQTLDLIQLDDNEAAFNLTTCTFANDTDIYLAVSAGVDVELNPKKFTASTINLYKFTDNGTKLQLVYKTEIEDICYALTAFQNRLAAGVGKSLRLFEMGKKKLLRKCETKSIPCTIVNIHTMGDRLVVGDIQESIHFVKYKRSENMLYVFADDTVPRYITSSTILDYDTVAGCDKFGNVFVVRLPQNVSEEVEEDPTGSKLRFETGLLNGAPHKLEHIAQFYVGDMVNTITKASLTYGGPEVLLYTTLTGAIGALVPFTSREDVDFFSTLEMQLRAEHPPLCGRDHLAYRSYYFPVKNVIDGDLCEQYLSLDPIKQRAIAEELSRSPAEVLKKLEDLRSQKLL